MSPAMLRARRPYFWKNMGAFGILGGISLSVYLYTYNFLMQDDFENIPIPPIKDEDLTALRKEYEEKSNSASRTIIPARLPESVVILVYILLCLRILFMSFF